MRRIPTDRVYKAMRALTFQGPGQVRIEERPMPQLLAPDDAVVHVDATGVCGSDLHIYHGRLKIEPGFTIGHEYVGTVSAAGDAVTRVQVGDRVAGCFQTACRPCFHCMPRASHPSFPSPPSPPPPTTPSP